MSSYCDVMFVAGVLLLCLATVTGGVGLRNIMQSAQQNPLRPHGGYHPHVMAPIQLAIAAIFSVSAVVVLAAPQRIAVIVLVLCILGVTAMIAAGSWQAARLTYRLTIDSAERQATTATCSGHCTGCALLCHK